MDYRIKELLWSLNSKRKPMVRSPEFVVKEIGVLSRWDRFWRDFGRLELVVGFIVLLVAVPVAVAELEALASQRTVNAWQLLNDDKKGLSGKGAALSYLSQSHYCIWGTDWCLADKEDLSGIELGGMMLRKADLRGARLHGARLQGVDLQYADLQGGDLQNANLQGGDLFGVDLRGAYLLGANLQGTVLTHADLSGVFGVTRRQLEEACITIDFLQPTLPDHKDLQDLELGLCE